MSEHKSFKSKNYPLDILKRLLDSPQLLPNEDPEEFLQLFESLEDYAKPQTSRDHMAGYQAAVLAWENHGIRVLASSYLPDISARQSSGCATLTHEFTNR